MAFDDYKTALVTGASSGIGAAVVTALAGRGMTVHMVARRGERLAEIAERTGAIAHVLDLRETDEVHARLGDLEVDVLINNAGLGRGYESFFATDPAEIDTVLDTNITAALHVVRATAPGMIGRKRGHIVNIGSIAGLYPIKFALYAASKGAIHLFSQNLRIELQGTGIRVTEICPGRVATEFFEGAFSDEEARRKFVDGFEILQPEDIADAIVYALDAPWRVNVGRIELTPTEQTLGGGAIVPVERAG